MDAGTIVAIVIGAILLFAVAVALGRFAASRREHQRLEQRREEAVDIHRSEAEARHARADMAEQRAKLERSEAELHETRAQLHEKGLADEQLQDEELERGTEPEDVVEPDARREPSQTGR